jgi:hypothetical protein
VKRSATTPDVRLLYFQDRFRSVVAAALRASRELQSLQAQLEEAGYDFDIEIGLNATRWGGAHSPRKRRRLSATITKRDRAWAARRGLKL